MNRDRNVSPNDTTAREVIGAPTATSCAPEVSFHNTVESIVTTLPRWPAAPRTGQPDTDAALAAANDAINLLQSRMVLGGRLFGGRRGAALALWEHIKRDVDRVAAAMDRVQQVDDAVKAGLDVVSPPVPGRRTYRFVAAPDRTLRGVLWVQVPDDGTSVRVPTVGRDVALPVQVMS